MTTLYKLTDKDGVTGAEHGAPLRWAAGVTHEIAAADYSGVLCGGGIIHAYESPLVGVFMHPIHSKYRPARLWRCKTRCKIIRDGQLKCGTRKLTCVEELPLPEIPTAARVRAAILCALKVCDVHEWRDWASKWLSGADRSSRAASAVRLVALSAGAGGAAWAADSAAAAARAEVADSAAMTAARWAYWAAGNSLDLHATIERAINEERSFSEHPLSSS